MNSLGVLSENFEDAEAFTTFFLVGPKNRKAMTGKRNRALAVFKVNHSPGALIDALIPFKEFGINLIHVHSMHAGNREYHFAIEIECEDGSLEFLSEAFKAFEKNVECRLIFGPFKILSI